MRRVGVVVFPGTNCERDVAWAIEHLGGKAREVFHRASDLPDVDAVVIPGGFAHGDHLRPGAIARFSPVMQAVRDFAAAGRPVVGICNGFQILCESGLLPGALRKNAGLKFLCKWVDLEIVTTDTPFTSRAEVGQRLRIPINHFEGNWFRDEQTLPHMTANDQIVLRYIDNPNGSLDSIAGICNADKNVFGLMPHPERACESLLGSEDGAVIFSSIVEHLKVSA